VVTEFLRPKECDAEDIDVFWIGMLAADGDAEEMDGTET